MHYLIFNTQQEANALNNRITGDLLPSLNDGVTNNYCDVKKHPTEDLWAIVVDPNYVQYFTPQELADSVELTEDWNFVPPIE